MDWVIDTGSTPLAFGVPASSAGRSDPIYDREKAAAVTAQRTRQEIGELGEFVSLSDGPSSGGPRSGRPSRGSTSTALGDAWDDDDGAGALGDTWSTSRRYGGTSPLLQLHEDLLDFYEACRPTVREQAMRDELIERVGALVGQVWPGASVRVFGSFSTGLYLPESDIDLVCVGTGLEDASKSVRGAALHRFAAALRAAPWSHAQLEVVDKAKVPIIKFVDGATAVAVDVCIETRDGLISSSLARKANGQFPAYKVLVLVLKRFLHERGLHDTFSGGVGSYLLQLTVISSLQFPCVTDAAPRGNLGTCLLHFFEVFGLRFNYETVGISLTNGGSFFDKHQRQWYNPDRPQLLSVENPLDTAHDVGANSFNIQNVKRAFRHAYFTLQAAIAGGRSGGRARLSMLGEVLDIAAEMGERFELHAAHGTAPLALAAAASNGQQQPQQTQPRSQAQQPQQAEQQSSQQSGHGAPGRGGAANGASDASSGADAPAKAAAAERSMGEATGGAAGGLGEFVSLSDGAPSARPPQPVAAAEGAEAEDDAPPKAQKKKRAAEGKGHKRQRDDGAVEADTAKAGGAGKKRARDGGEDGPPAKTRGKLPTGGGAQEGGSEVESAKAGWSVGEDRRLLNAMATFGSSAVDRWVQVSQLVGRPPKACKRRGSVLDLAQQHNGRAAQRLLAQQQEK